MYKPGIWSKVSYVILVLIAVVVIMPIVMMVIGSVSEPGHIEANYSLIYDEYNFSNEYATLKTTTSTLTIKQYLTVLLGKLDILLGFWNGIYLVVPILMFGLVIAVTGGYAFAKFDFWGKQIFLFAYILVMLLPTQVTLVPQFIFFYQINLIGSRWAVILPGIFSTFGVFLIYQFMRKIPDAPIESAGLEGASELRIFWSIVLPQCRSGMIAYIMLTLIDYWNMIEQPLILLNSEAQYPLSVLLRTVNRNELGIAFASGVLYMLPMFLLFMLISDDLVEGISNTMPQVMKKGGKN
ncbi:MAG: carbohydrate ABC transporter permease [Clostridia bacterium]|nr:carbohydrate ABC transporter permease [Clostridia bacterium]